MRRIGLCLLLSAACARAEPSTAEVTKAHEAQAGTGKAEVAKADDAKADEAKVDEAKADEAKAEAVDPIDAKADEAEPDGAPAPPTESTRAIVLADGKLQRLAPHGTTELLAEAPGVTSCAVDDEHRVVWLLSKTEMSAYDPSDGRVHAIASGIAAQGAADVADWQVQREDPPSPFPLVTAANVDGIDACVALVVLVSSKPSAGGGVIADGDRQWYCFEDDGEGGFVDGKLLPDEARLKKRYDRTKLVGTELLVALHARHAKDGPRERPDPEPPPAPAPAVDKSRCEEDNTACGAVEYVGGGRLWRVITSNARGDFFYEGHHLFDAKRNEWWDPSTGKHSRTPDGESAIVASPDGTWGIYADKLFALASLEQTGTFSGTLCGWE